MTQENNPIVPVIEGDGIGPEVVGAAVKVLDRAVKLAYSGKKAIGWLPLNAGKTAFEKFGSWLPEATLDAIQHHGIALKGPLETPVGKGIRSLNVALRQALDLYACVRPVRHFKEAPSPMKHPEKLDIVIFRENTEDVYAGIEFAKGSEQALKLIALLKEFTRKDIRLDSGIGIKPMSEYASKRLVHAAISYALEKGRKSVTLVHKGNIMKFTEGAFMQWGYEVAQEFGDKVILEKDAGKYPTGLVIKDRIADSMFHQILFSPQNYDVIATPNLIGDLLSDACAAQVGGLGIAPGANINFETGHAVFEATHGTSPKHAGKNKANPCSMILSGELMLRHLGWNEAADLVVAGVEKAIKRKEVTYDFANHMEDARKVSCSDFTEIVLKRMESDMRSRARLAMKQMAAGRAQPRTGQPAITVKAR